MKERYTGQTTLMGLDHGAEYEVISTECGWYRIIDKSKEDYLYPPQAFEIIDKYPIPPVALPMKEPNYD